MTTPDDHPPSEELLRLGLLAGPFGHDARVFHVGIVVSDLAAAIEQYGALLDVTFTEPMDLPFPVIHTPDGDLPLTMRCAYSTRPLNVELVQAAPGTLWDVDHPMQGRHLGVWADDVAVHSQRLSAAGMPRVAWGTGDDGRELFCYHRTPLGFYIELVDDIAKDFYPAWFASVDPALAGTP